MNKYIVKKVDPPFDISAPLESDNDCLSIDNFLKESSSHRPVTKCKLVHDGKGFYGIFQVNDRYVRCVHTELNSNVCLDSCVEFFVKPPGDKGYFNLEINCGGTALLYHVQDHRICEKGLSKFSSATNQDMKKIRIFHTTPKVVEPEITEAVTWRIGFYLPFEFFESRIGFLGNVSGQKWRANFYKCGSHTSHPHWATWNPVTAKNFHLPECFGEIVLE